MSLEGCQHGPSALGFGPTCVQCEHGVTLEEGVPINDLEIARAKAKQAEQIRPAASVLRDLQAERNRLEVEGREPRLTRWSQGEDDIVADQAALEADPLLREELADLRRRADLASRDYQPASESEREAQRTLRKNAVRQRLFTDAEFHNAVETALAEVQSLFDVRLYGRQADYLRWAAALALLKAEEQACPSSPHGHVTSKTTGVCSWCGATP